MIQRVFAIGVLGAIVLIGGCSSCLSPGSDTAQGTTATTPNQALVSTVDPQTPVVQTAGEKAAKTKQVTIAVSGMT